MSELQYKMMQARQQRYNRRRVMARGARYQRYTRATGRISRRVQVRAYPRTNIIRRKLATSGADMSGGTTDSFESFKTVQNVCKRDQPNPRMYKRPPVIRGTSHKTESIYVWNSSTAGGNNPAVYDLSRLQLAKSTGAGIETSAIRKADFDNYISAIGTDVYPSARRRVYFKGTAVRLQCENLLETNVQCKVVLLRPKYDMQAAVSQINYDPTRPINDRHYRTLMKQTFVMNPIDIGGVKGNSLIVKNFWFPAGVWRKTASGDPATQPGDWDVLDISQFQYFGVFTNDASSVDGEFVTFTMNVRQFWYTIDDLAT